VSLGRHISSDHSSVKPSYCRPDSRNELLYDEILKLGHEVIDARPLIRRREAKAATASLQCDNSPRTGILRRASENSRPHWHSCQRPRISRSRRLVVRSPVLPNPLMQPTGQSGGRLIKNVMQQHHRDRLKSQSPVRTSVPLQIVRLVRAKPGRRKVRPGTIYRLSQRNLSIFSEKRRHSRSVSNALCLFPIREDPIGLTGAETARVSTLSAGAGCGALDRVLAYRNKQRASKPSASGASFLRISTKFRCEDRYNRSRSYFPTPPVVARTSEAILCNGTDVRTGDCDFSDHDDVAA